MPAAHVGLYINGAWSDAKAGETIPVFDPATEEKIATVAKAGTVDLDRALDASSHGFVVWRRTSPFKRAEYLQRAAAALKARAETIAQDMVREEGKPLVQARSEVAMSIEAILWFAGEAQRAYGRVVTPRVSGVTQVVLKEPVGPVAAFTPWNYPVSQAVRKISAAIAAGCSIIVKGPEETPVSCAAMVDCFHEAGIPQGVVGLVFGDPAEISSYLIPHPVIRKVSFTGSSVVGKQLAALAGHHMKRVTMELGGHSPAVVFADADVEAAADLLVALKFDNAGQSCIAPTRFLIQDSVHDRFVDRFVETTSKIKVGNGLDPDVTMGPMANARRLEGAEFFVKDALANGGRLKAGGSRIGNRGYFYEPTVITQASPSMRAMHEEPFAPVAFVTPFRQQDEAVAEINRLPYGLATYLFTGNPAVANAVSDASQSGMVAVNHFGLGLPETPFGGTKDSGYGSEGGAEAVEGYLETKFVTQRFG